MGIMNKITATTAAFTLAAAFVTPVRAGESPAASEDSLAGTINTGIKDTFRILGGLAQDAVRAPAAAAGLANKAIEGTDKAAKENGLDLTAGSKIPTYVGVIPGAGEVACYKQITGRDGNPAPDPEEKPRLYSTAMPETGPGYIATHGRQFGTDYEPNAMGKPNPGLQAITGLATLATINCEKAVQRGYLHPFQSGKGASRVATNRSNRNTGKWNLIVNCPGIPVDPENVYGVKAVLPRTMPDKLKYGGGTILMLCDPGDKMAPFKPITPDYLIGGSLHPFSVEESQKLADLENKKHVALIENEARVQGLLQNAATPPPGFGGQGSKP